MTHRLRLGSTLGAWLLVAWVPLQGVAAQPQLLDADSRLSHSTELEARHLPLAEALRRMGDPIGVSLKTEGEAADLRLTAFIVGAPLREVLLRLAVLLHLTWRRAGDGDKSEYTLYLSREDRAAVEAAKANEWQRFRANIRRLIRAAGGRVIGSNDPLDRAAEEIVSSAAPRAAAQLVATLSDALLDAMMRGDTVRLSFRDLSPGQQEAVRAYQKAQHSSAVALHGQAGPKVYEANGRRIVIPPPGEPDPVEQGGVELRVDRGAGDGQRAQVVVRLWGPHGGAGGVSFGIDPSRSLAFEDQLRLPRHFDSRQCMLPAAPVLKLPGPESSSTWEQALFNFASENHLSVLSDAFDTGDRRPGYLHIRPPEPGASVDQFLDRLCMPYDYTWNAETPLLIFRKRDWYLERDRQIPERLARHWRWLSLEEGAFPLAELARMAGMNDGQRAKLWKYAGVRAWDAVLRNRDLLLLYAALRPEQQALARSDGLTIDRFDIAQQKLLRPVLDRVRPGPLDLRRSFVRLEMREEPDERSATVALVFRDGARRTVHLDRRAEALRDPWSTNEPPLLQPAGSR